MKRIVLLTALCTSSIGYSQAQNFNPDDYSYRLRGCTGFDACDYTIESGTLTDLINKTALQMRSKSTNGKGTQRLASGISSATGMVLSAVKTAITGMQQSAVAAGFDTFTGTLSGPSGSISFRMNLASGAWSFWGSSDLEPQPEPPKELMPDFGEK